MSSVIPLVPLNVRLANSDSGTSGLRVRRSITTNTANSAPPRTVVAIAEPDHPTEPAAVVPYVRQPSAAAMTTVPG